MLHIKDFFISGHIKETKIPIALFLNSIESINDIQTLAEKSKLMNTQKIKDEKDITSSMELTGEVTLSKLSNVLFFGDFEKLLSKKELMNEILHSMFGSNKKFIRSTMNTILEYVENNLISLSFSTKKDDDKDSALPTPSVEEISIDKNAIQIASHLSFTGPFQMNRVLLILTKATNAATKHIILREQMLLKQNICTDTIKSNFDRDIKQFKTSRNNDIDQCIGVVNFHRNIVGDDDGGGKNNFLEIKNNPSGTPQPFMENGPPRAAVSGQNYLNRNAPLDGSDAYIGRHSSLERLGPLGEHNLNKNYAIGMEDDLNRQDTLQWIYGSKELKKQPLPIAVKDDNVPMEKVMAPSLPVNALQESGSYFNDGGSNVKINNQITSEPISGSSIQPQPFMQTIPNAIKNDEGSIKSLGAFDNYGKPEKE